MVAVVGFLIAPQSTTTWSAANAPGTAIEKVLQSMLTTSQDVPHPYRSSNCATLWEGNCQSCANRCCCALIVLMKPLAKRACCRSIAIQGNQASIIMLAEAARGACTCELTRFCSVDWRGPLSFGSTFFSAMARGVLRAFVLLFVLCLFVFAISLSSCS